MSQENRKANTTVEKWAGSNKHRRDSHESGGGYSMSVDHGFYRPALKHRAESEKFSPVLEGEATQTGKYVID